MSIEKALIVDDSKSARFALRKKLQQMECSVDLVESAKEAFEYLDSHLPDVIFMDHFMPGMDGFEATQSIKRNPAWADIPVVMCTSKEGENYGQEAISQGAFGIIPKPATQDQIQEILNKINEVMAQRPAVLEQATAAAPAEEPETNTEFASPPAPVAEPIEDNTPTEPTKSVDATTSNEAETTEDHEDRAITVGLENYIKSIVRSTVETISNQIIEEHLEPQITESQTTLSETLSTQFKQALSEHDQQLQTLLEQKLSSLTQQLENPTVQADTVEQTDSAATQELADKVSKQTLALRELSTTCQEQLEKISQVDNQMALINSKLNATEGKNNEVDQFINSTTHKLNEYSHNISFHSEKINNFASEMSEITQNTVEKSLTSFSEELKDSVYKSSVDMQTGMDETLEAIKAKNDQNSMLAISGIVVSIIAIALHFIM